MLLDIDGVLVKPDILREKFTCDLPNCHGRCCVVGDSGAPVTAGELQSMKDQYANFQPFLKPAGEGAIQKNGMAYTDSDGDQVLSLIEGRECAFSFQEKPVHKCAVEAAYFQGQCAFRKPLSCHLYPVRVEVYQGKDMLVYERNAICEAGRKLGKKLGTPLYMFLREALTRAYGEDWFEKLDYAAKNLDNQ